MRFITRRHLALAATLSLSGVALLPSTTAYGNVRGLDWRYGDSLSVTNYSNAAGFWQAIVCGNSSNIVLDGIFGTQTRSASLQFKKEVLGLTSATSGNVSGGTWLTTNVSSFLNGGTATHLQPSGGGFYSYYAGGSTGAELYWNGTDWKFLQVPTQTWYTATSS